MMAMERQSENVHFFTLATRNTGDRHNCINQALNILAIVGCHALLHGLLNLELDKTTTIDLPQMMGMTIVHQFFLVSTAVNCITGLAHKVVKKDLGKGHVIEVHARKAGRSLDGILRIAMTNAFIKHGLPGVNAKTTNIVLRIAQSSTKISKRGIVRLSEGVLWQRTKNSYSGMHLARIYLLVKL